MLQNQKKQSLESKELQYISHEELKRAIINNPNLLDLEGILAFKEEVPYLREGRKIGQIDLVLWDSYGQPYLVEVTASTNGRARRRNRIQAKKAKRYFNFTSFSISRKDNHLEIVKFD